MTRYFLPLALATSVLAALPAAAQKADTGPKITVTGEGEARVSPDMAVVMLAVLREAKTAREAMDESNAAMAAVIAALKEEGVEARDLQTSGLAISPQYVYPNERNNEEKPRIAGYQVTNTLRVRVRALEKVGEVLDRAVSLGVNQGGDIVFTNEDPEEALNNARAHAVENALSKARTLAEAAGATVGDVLEIAERAGTPPPAPMVQTMRMEQAADSAVPVEAGENSYKVKVSVTFALEME